MGGSHRHEATEETRRMRSLAMKIIVPIAILTAIAMAVLWPKQGIEITGYAPAEQLKARVISVYQEPCEDGIELQPNGCGTATIELERDAKTGKSTEVDLPAGPGEPVVMTGDKVLVIEGDSLGQVTHTIVDHQRTNYLWMLGIAFVLALLAFGRMKGLTALLGLAVTFAMLLFFMVPAMLAGESPVVVAVVGTTAIALTVLYMTHGFSLTTTVAVLGTLAALLLTGGLALFSVAAMHLSGITDDVAQSVYVTHGVNMQGLLIASIMIGSLGVLDDVTVTQAATVAELSYANPDSSFMELYRAASRIGRSHIASVVNTIILAYAGTSLPILLVIVADHSSLGGVLSTQLISQELVRSAVATLGLIAAVPITTALATVAARNGDAPAFDYLDEELGEA